MSDSDRIEFLLKFRMRLMIWFCYNFHDACGACGDGLEGATFRATS